MIGDSDRREVIPYFLCTFIGIISQGKKLLLVNESVGLGEAKWPCKVKLEICFLHLWAL